MKNVERNCFYKIMFLFIDLLAFEPGKSCISQFQAWSSPAPRQKRVQNPRAYKNELKPHPWGIFLDYSP